MFYGILGVILNSFSDITYKKALSLSENKISDKMFQFLAVFQGIVLMTIFGYLFFSDSQIIQIYSQFSNIKIIGLISTSVIIGIIAEFLFQYAFKNEKVSVLTPFGQLEGIFTVLLGFIFLSGNSVVAFLFAMLAGIILLGTSIDFKKITINKYCFGIILASFLTALQYLIYGSILLEITPESLLVIETGLSLVFLFIMILFYRELKTIKSTKAKFHKMLFVNTITWYVSLFLGMYVISEFGVVQAVLIGMLGLATNLVFSYFFLKESITRKEIVVTVLVGLCVACGTLLG